MKLKIRYENEYQTITLDAETTEELWVSLSLEGEGLSQDEREKLIQEEWEKQFNRPDYNCWHKFWRHHGESKAKPGDEEDEVDTSEPLMDEVVDDRIFRKDELGQEERESYEVVCQLARGACGKKADLGTDITCTGGWLNTGITTFCSCRIPCWSLITICANGKSGY